MQVTVFDLQDIDEGEAGNNCTGGFLKVIYNH